MLGSHLSVLGNDFPRHFYRFPKQYGHCPEQGNCFPVQVGDGTVLVRHLRVQEKDAP